MEFLIENKNKKDFLKEIRYKYLNNDHEKKFDKF